METFFATDAESDLADDLRYQGSIGTRYLSRAISLIRDSVKFRIPDNGYILPGLRESKKQFGEIIDDYIPEFRLPYPKTLLEYRFDVERKNYGNGDAPAELITTSYTGVILLAEESGDSCISLTPIWKTEIDGKSKWVMANFCANIDSSQQSLSIDPITEAGAMYGANSSIAVNDLRGEVSCLLEFLAALSCSNAEPELAPHSREKLNKKRQKKGKPPFYSYRVLTITQNGSGGGGAGTSGRSPRVHLRRGHIRRLPNKTVWVNASVVGDKSKGFAAKDYAMPMRTDIPYTTI